MQSNLAVRHSVSLFLLLLVCFFGLNHWTLLRSKFNLSISTKIKLVRYDFAMEANLTSAERIEAALKRKIKDIKSFCGEVCNTSISGPFDSITGMYVVRKNFECPNIFKYAHIHDQPDSKEMQEPFSEFPDWLLDDFTYNGRIEVHNMFYLASDFRNPVTTFKWETQTIEEQLKQTLSGDLNLQGSYSSYDNAKIMNGIRRMKLRGKRVLVVGSQLPWLEVLLLANDVGEVVTLEYATIECTVPKLKSITPPKFIESYLAGTLEPFDAMLTFSSLEHSGLGRYGDGLHPWGDLVAMSRVWCVLKENALILFGAPTGLKDEIIFNAHKCYGSVMTSQLLANFELIWTSHPGRKQTSEHQCGGHAQAVIVARRIS